MVSPVPVGYQVGFYLRAWAPEDNLKLLIIKG